MAGTCQNIAYDVRPTLVVIGDRPERQAAAQASAARLDARVIGPLSPAAAIDMLDAGTLDAVLADIADEEALDRVLDRLQEAAAAGRYASVVRLPAAMIDRVAARAPHAAVALLVDEDEQARAAALENALALARAPDPRLGERERPSPRLAQLSEEVGRIARTLAALSSQDDHRASEMRDTVAAEAPTATTVRTAIRARRLREQYFDSTLFANPAWDMLLDLMAARLERRHVAVSSLCIAAAVPPTTALRWMKQLTDEGLFVRVADPRDGRRVFIELADEAAAGMSAYFQAIARAGIAMP